MRFSEDCGVGRVYKSHDAGCGEGHGAGSCSHVLWFCIVLATDAAQTNWLEDVDFEVDIDIVTLL